MNYPTEAEFQAWLADRPESVRRVAAVVPLTTCYRLKSTGERGHYMVHSYAENGTLTLRHGRDSTLPGVGVFGINPEDVVRCGCGKWEPPTEAQYRATKARIEREHSASCRDPRCSCRRRGRS